MHVQRRLLLVQRTAKFTRAMRSVNPASSTHLRSSRAFRGVPHNICRARYSCMNGRFARPACMRSMRGFSAQSSASSAGGAIKIHNMPDVGEGTVEVKILEWLVKPGDKVKSLQCIGLAEYGKGNIDILAPYKATVGRLLVEAGDMAQCGHPLMEFEVAGSSAGNVSKSDVSSSSSDGSNSGSKSSAPSSQSAPSASASASPSAGIAAGKKPQQVKALPGARVLAKQLGLDITMVPPSGRQGQILKEDVQRFHQSGGGSSAATAAGSLKLEYAKAAAPLEGDIVEKITGIKVAMTQKMNESNLVAQFGYGDEISVDELMKVRRQLKPIAEKMGVKLSFMPFFIKAVSMALLEYPMLNSHVNQDCTELIHRASHNIGIAVDSPQGLVVPNIKDVQNKSVLQIAQDMEGLIERAKAQRLSQSDITGGTFTLSNIGAIGGTYCRPIVFVPEVCIGALGKIQTLPRFDDNGQVYPASLFAVSWSADHRVIDGATVARFSNQWKQYLENPSSMLLSLK